MTKDFTNLSDRGLLSVTRKLAKAREQRGSYGTESHRANLKALRAECRRRGIKHP